MIDLIEKHKDMVLKILYEYVPEIEVWVFGSRCDGKAKPFSDLDIVLLGSNKIDLSIKARLSAAFEESDLPYRVDILDWNNISDNFKNIIINKHEVLVPSPTSPCRASPCS